MIVKICGIIDEWNAGIASEAGADWIGINLVAGPRKVTLDSAGRILSSMANISQAVALVTVENHSIESRTLALLRQRNVEKLQLYGDVTAQSIETLTADGFKVIYVVPIDGRSSVDNFHTFLSSCRSRGPQYVLFDAAMPGRLGGTGRVADWDLIADAAGVDPEGGPEVLLAGGLTPDNVAEAIHKVKPLGVDVCSGVEVRPGVKDRAKVEAFVSAVRSCEDRIA